MKQITVENLKAGDTILTFDPNLFTWIKCKIVQIEKY
ncbi:unnamed protein product, partial [marine sediment metagenome]